MKVMSIMMAMMLFSTAIAEKKLELGAYDAGVHKKTRELNSYTAEINHKEVDVEGIQ